MMEWILILILVLLVALGLWTALRIRLDGPAKEELARLRLREEDYQRLLVKQQEEAVALQTVQAERARLAAELEHERRAAAEKMALLEQAETRLKLEFENLASKIFEERGRNLSEQHRQQLGGILQPLKEQLDSFRTRVDELHKQGTEQSTLLLAQVRHLQELSGKVSAEANELAKAIKGDSKTQGDWGEVIVERIFESSGLVRDREYRVQASIRDSDGQLKRPDFIVDLPGEKSVIVDSKVSLTAYERCHSATDDDEKKMALKEHVQSVRRHIDQLQAKDYAELMGNRTLDFVILCIPLESAYQAAMQADPELIYDVSRSPIVITGPNTLMVTLKLIAQIWRRENENRNAEKIADRAGKLYDQVARLAESMLDARKRLAGTSESFDKVMRQLQEGRGNLLGRVEQLRELGAKVSKRLPLPALEDSVDSEAEDEPLPGA